MATKKELIAISVVSFLLTTIGLMVDSDPKNLSIWTTVFEYFAMLAIIFASLSLIYYVVTFIFRNVRAAIS